MSLGLLTLNITVIFMIANIILAFVLVFLERRNPAVTWAWLLVLLFIPGLGFILYLFLGQDLRKKRLFSIKEEEDLARIVNQQEILLQRHDLDFNNPIIEEYKDMIKLYLQSAQSVFSQNNNITILNNGQEKFPALLKALENAKDHIHMEYYIIRNDDIGKKVRDILVRKAQEGLEVRVLYDGMGCLTLPKSYFKPLIDAGAHVASFFPPFIPYINIRVNYRNHRKITIIDGKKAFIGGLNLGDEYLGKSPKYGFWRDTHLLLEGSAVDSLQLRFIMDWKFASKHSLPYSLRYFPHKQWKGNSGVQIISSGPDSRWPSVHQAYFKLITSAKKNIYIQSPYFVPDDSLMEALKVAALGGVDVRIIIPCKPDHPFVYWASTSYAAELLASGARTYKYMNGFLHSKMVLVDGKIGSVGTANMDIRSFKTNFEVNTFIYDEKIINSLEQTFIDDLKKCEEITRDTYNKRPMKIKFKESISRLLSPLL